MAIDLLEGQHREMERLFERIRTTERGGARVRLIGQLAELITLHSALEERYFYPVLRVEGMTHLVERSFAEHGEVKRLVSDLMEMKQRDPRLDELLARIEGLVKKHVAEEEGELFTRAREVASESVLAGADGEMRRAMGDLQEKELLEIADEAQGAVPM